MTASPSFPFGPIPAPVPLRAVELPQDREPEFRITVARPRHRELLRAVLDAVVLAHEVTEEEIRGKSRLRRIVAARHLVWCLLRDHRWSWVEIAREFAVDHTTVCAAVRQMGAQR